MVDTIRSLAALQSLLADNTSGNISAQDIRDFLVSAHPDPIPLMFGTPDTAFEFDTSSLTGLTALSPTPDVEDADTTVPHHYYVQDNASGIAWCGRSLSPPATPYTAITKVYGNWSADWNTAGLFIGEATPGNMDIIWAGSNTRHIRAERHTPTSFGTSFATISGNTGVEEVYLAIKVNASNDVDFLFSRTGKIWRKVTDGRNPSITIGSVGIAGKSENSNGSAHAFDYLRIWESALTFPGE